AFVPGIVAVDNPATPGFDEATATLFSHVNSLTSPFTGSGSGFLDITGGNPAIVAKLDSNAFPNGADIFLNSDVCSPPGVAGCPGGAGTWPVSSQDPLTFQTTTNVPEPTTILLLGVGLSGLWFLKRRSTEN